MTAPAAVLSYTITAAANAVGLSEDSIRRLIANSDLPVKFYGRRPLIPAAALASWFASLPSERPTK